MYGEGSGLGSGRVRLFVGNRGSGRVGSTFRPFESKKSYPWTTLRGRGGAKIIEEHFPEASAWGVFVRRFWPAEFLSAGDFGLRSFCQLAISTWVEILCPVKFNKVGPWGGGWEEAGRGRGGQNLNGIQKKLFSNLINLVHCWRPLKTTCCIRLCRCALCC